METNKLIENYKEAQKKLYVIMTSSKAESFLSLMDSLVNYVVDKNVNNLIKEATGLVEEHPPAFSLEEPPSREYVTPDFIGDKLRFVSASALRKILREDPEFAKKCAVRVKRKNTLNPKWRFAIRNFAWYIHLGKMIEFFRTSKGYGNFYKRAQHPVYKTVIENYLKEVHE